MKLTIIGNGFDIHHNYKTSFNNFREFLIENENIGLVKKIDEFTGEALNRKNNSQIKENNLLWNQFEELLNYYHPHDKLFSVKSIDSQSEYLYMIDLLDEFTEEFFNYIKKITSVKTNVFNEKIALELSSSDLIITFNYTDTLNIYKMKSNVEILYINGRLKEDNLPIIGYYKDYGNSKSIDYLEKFRYIYYSKSALAYKRNSINYENRYAKVLNSFSKKIDEFVSIGFSYGNSDSHIKEIMQNLIIPQVRLPRMPLYDYENLKKVSFKVFNYDDKETNKIFSILKKLFPVNQTTITGIGFKKEIKDLITFNKIDY